MEQARMRRRGTAVLLDFWLPAAPRGSPAGRTWTHTSMSASPHVCGHAIEVRMLLSFQRPPRLCFRRGLLRMRLPGRPLRGPPSGQQSLAHPPGVSNPRKGAPSSAAARNCSTPKPGSPTAPSRNRIVGRPGLRRLSSAGSGACRPAAPGRPDRPPGRRARPPARAPRRASRRPRPGGAEPRIATPRRRWR
jgi:hypothetical protein